MDFIVGIDGMIGGAVFAEAKARGLDVAGSTRRPGSPGWHLDLESASVARLPDTIRTAYILAGVAGYKNCEGNPRAHHVNVDGTIALAKALVSKGAFIVFMSSDAVEGLLGTSYGMQKALVEVFLQSVSDPAIVRSGRVERHMLPDLCDLLIGIGQSQTPGIFNFKPSA